MTCKKCGIHKNDDDFYRGRSACKDCERARSQAYREANRERTLESGRRYAADNREKRAAYQKDYYSKNAEALREKSREYKRQHADAIRESSRLRYEANAEVYRERRKKYYRENSEAERARALDWHRRNPDKSRDLCSRRRARMASAPVVEKIDRRYVIDRDGSRCHICRKRCAESDIHLDHLVPLALGGEHSTRNLAVACSTCNLRKSDGSANDQLMLVG